MSPAAGRAQVMSVDVEDWHNATILQVAGLVLPPGDAVRRNTETLLAIFEELGIHATWFFLGEVAERFPELVRAVVAAGHEPGIHGYHHHQVAALSRREYEAALRRAKTAVEQAGGVEVMGYRAVDFGICEATRWALEVLVDIGLRYDSSIFPRKGRRYGMQGAPLEPHWISVHGAALLEIPVTVARLGPLRLPCGGGGYFRHFPYFYTSFGLRCAQSRGQPVVFYLHPAEIEATDRLGMLPPELSQEQRRRFRLLHWMQNRGRRRTVAKLKRLAATYRFDTARCLYEELAFP